jgi:hypothetical protein
MFQGIGQGQFALSLDDSIAFARLSGDFNPLHVDPSSARRTSFGGSVVHGVHALLRVLDGLATQAGMNGLNPVSLSATFDNPIRTGAVASFSFRSENGQIRLAVETGGRPAFSATFALASSSTVTAAFDDSEFTNASPADVEFPPSDSENEVPVKLHKPTLAQLLPALSRGSSVGWIADLLATTQIVGMRCPGQHSIYSGFRLRFVRSAPAPTHSMRYRVTGAERRFQLLRIQVDGQHLAGSIEAFFRPRPVLQRSLKEIAAFVQPHTLSGDRALVIGGSRGLGEITAKILLAAGAAVTVTYSQGKDDAERVCTEALFSGHTCVVRHLDVLRPYEPHTPQWLGAGRFTHVYFFASPRIPMSSGKWDPALFSSFVDVYVTALTPLVDQASAGRGALDPPLQFLYPSTIFISQPERGFFEYAVAKAAGEALCEQLESQYAVRFSKPRLPRMRTDQTAALTDSSVADPLPIILAMVRDLHSST